MRFRNATDIRRIRIVHTCRTQLDFLAACEDNTLTRVWLLGLMADGYLFSTGICHSTTETSKVSSTFRFYKISNCGTVPFNIDLQINRGIFGKLSKLTRFFRKLILMRVKIGCDRLPSSLNSTFLCPCLLSCKFWLYVFDWIKSWIVMIPSLCAFTAALTEEEKPSSFQRRIVISLHSVKDYMRGELSWKNINKQTTKTQARKQSKKHNQEHIS